MAKRSGVEIRDLDAVRDMPAIRRIWREIGWASDKRAEKQIPVFYKAGSCSVAAFDDEAECAVHAIPGQMQLDKTLLPLCVIAAVTTSRIGRGISLAQRLTARELAKARQRGDAVAVLGMFDQGFYNKVGFGTGAYVNEFALDPASLDVAIKPRTPSRLTTDNSDQMLASLLARPPLHGGVTINIPSLYKAELSMPSDGFGLGYFQGETLTHFIWMDGDAEHGPYKLRWMGYRDGAELLELLALLKSLADQVYSVRLIEPPHIQLQSLLKRPFRQQAIAGKGKFYADQNAYAWYQLRVLDVSQCVACIHHRGPALRFQLAVGDPVDEILAGDDLWSPLGGIYVVELSENSSARLVEKGDECPDLPTVCCTVNTLSRLLFGVSPATSLAITDGLEGPGPVLQALDTIIRANPNPGWDF